MIIAPTNLTSVANIIFIAVSILSLILIDVAAINLQIKFHSKIFSLILLPLPLKLAKNSHITVVDHN